MSIDATTNDPHTPEYLAAVAGMADTYGSPRPLDTFAVGDHISFRLAGWSEKSFDDGKVLSHYAGKLLVETATDIVEVDPRPWPIGNVLSF